MHEALTVGVVPLTFLLGIIERKKLLGRARWEQLQVNAIYALGDIQSASFFSM